MIPLIKVSVVEDHAGTLDALVRLINGWPGLTCVSGHRSGLDAVREIPALAPDVILVDLELPDLPGVDCMRQLRSVLPKAVVLVYSGHDQAEYLFPSLQAGADGYLLKGGPPDELLGGILAAYRGEVPMSGQVARKILAHFRHQAEVAEKAKTRAEKPHSPHESALLEDLTIQERDILDLLGAGQSTKALADGLGLSVRSVHSRLAGILVKLHVPNRTAAVALYASSKE